VRHLELYLLGRSPRQHRAGAEAQEDRVDQVVVLEDQVDRVVVPMDPVGTEAVGMGAVGMMAG
jgi:hypothetical protein